MRMALRERLLVDPGKAVMLADWDPADKLDFKKDDDREQALAQGIVRLDALQYLMYAERRHALLIVLQGMDAAGKDGTIRHVMSGFNPQGCRVTPFKEPSREEADHDFLWRVHRAVPLKGDIAIFNRSHYEDVLVARVRTLVPQEVWSRRYEQINQFESLLKESGVTIVKLFLHVSKDEQKQRFEERLKDPTKQWKLALGDFENRKYWDEYMAAYEDALARCSTDAAPWYIIPADRKWVRNLAVSQILVETLESLKMKFPKPSLDPSAVKLV
jgi:PPK2 family polyphosphate:nucleotide phosphotransferase